MKCIYQIKNKTNGHSYIGSSSDFEYRQKRHLYDLHRGRHHSVYLQRAFIKYGEEAFEFLILEENVENQFEREQYWIDAIKPEYNVGSVGGGNNILNHPNLEEIKKKQSLSSKTRYQKLTKEEREARKKYGSDNPNWKGGISSNSKCKNCGKRISPYKDLCVKCNKHGEMNPFFGKHHTDETKEKLRIKATGRKQKFAKGVIINGIKYRTYKDAAEAIGVSQGLILYRIKKGIYTAIDPKTSFGQDL